MKYILFFVIAVSCSQVPMRKQHSPYNRKAWAHWSDADKDCLNTRHEILLSRSLIPVKLNKKKCSVISGKWDDYYYPEVHFSSKKIDIDHLIPLKHAHDVGASVWSAHEKEVFANDPQNLVITNRTYNRKKGAKTIAEWLPVHKEFACRYIADWIKLKNKYQLHLSKAEENTIQKANCTRK